MNGSLLVTGTHSDAGKTVVVAGLCRWLARQGVAVAPFKAQNMALNSTVTADGAEIGRAQAVQAAAAGIEPTALMNPVLLKPGSDTHSQVIVLGRPWREVDALGYQPLKAQLREVVLDSLATLRAGYEVVVCEGAGSPAEINLRRDDLANMGLARAAGLPVLLVGDIDRGGVFASLFGTLALLDADDQRHVAGFVVNKFRGDRRLLAPGLAQLSALTGRPFLGVLGWRAGLWLDAEDSLDLEGERWTAGDPLGEVLRVSVVRLPRMSNYTDVDALASEPGVLVRLAGRAEELADADLVVLPGTRATVRDLAWLRERGLDRALRPAGRRGPADPGDLRRLPDARPGGHRPGGERPRDRARARPAAGGDHLRGRQDPAPAPGHRRRAAGRRLRDPPRGDPGRGRRAAAGRRGRDPRGLRGRGGHRHLLARPVRARPVPPPLPGRGRRPGRAGLAARVGPLRRGPGGPPRRPRGPRRRGPRHRRRARSALRRRPRRPAVRPTRRPGPGRDRGGAAVSGPAAVTVVGIGDDGWDGLTEPARDALRQAPVIVGSARQLALLPDLGVPREPLPSPLLARLDDLVAANPGLCLLASGDPMLHGLGATLAGRLGAGRLRVLPAVSSVALACARLGWAEHEVDVVSVVARPVEVVLPAVQPGARLLVLCRDGDTPGRWPGCWPGVAGATAS